MPDSADQNSVLAFALRDAPNKFMVAIHPTDGIMFDWESIDQFVLNNPLAVGHMAPDANACLFHLLFAARELERQRCLDICKIVSSQVNSLLNDKPEAYGDSEISAAIAMAKTISAFVRDGSTEAELMDGAPDGETLQ